MMEDHVHEDLGLRERKKLKMRAAIETAAGERFEQLGYEKTRCQDVCNDLEISSPTFFRYFPGGKVELFIAWSQRRVPRMTATEALTCLVGEANARRILELERSEHLDGEEPCHAAAGSDRGADRVRGAAARRPPAVGQDREPAADHAARPASADSRQGEDQPQQRARAGSDRAAASEPASGLNAPPSRAGAGQTA
jgi:AcrR family transcriptional regulator